jgi:hypothetical protein
VEYRPAGFRASCEAVSKWSLPTINNAASFGLPTFMFSANLLRGVLIREQEREGAIQVGSLIPRRIWWFLRYILAAGHASALVV